MTSAKDTYKGQYICEVHTTYLGFELELLLTSSLTLLRSLLFWVRKPTSLKHDWKNRSEVSLYYSASIVP